MFGKRILMAKAGAEGSRKRTVKEREKYIMSLVNQMTLDEKIGMIHGAGLFRTAAVPRLGIPELHMSDSCRWECVRNLSIMTGRMYMTVMIL